MKKLLSLALATLATTGALAQQDKPKISVVSDIKFSGYVMSQYQYSDKEANDGTKDINTFNIRMVRMALEGRLMQDFYWKVQLQANGNTSDLGSSPRMVDAFAEWQKFDAFKVKAGQFKRPFTFENPMHPITQGFMGYSQNVTKLSGFSDRVGEHASNGRDIGVQIQGDIIKNQAGRNLVHYQIGVFNGQGTGQKDVDQRKDVIGGLWVMPVKGLRLGAFGWTGSYARKGTWNVTDANHKPVLDEQGNNVVESGVRSLKKNRYAFSAEYAANDWTFRSEYIHGTGEGFKTSDNEKNPDLALNGFGNKADGVYAAVIAPVVKHKAHVKARYNMYRRSGEWNSMKTMYEIGADYKFSKNIGITAEYVFVNDRTLQRQNYNMADVQLQFRF